MTTAPKPLTPDEISFAKKYRAFDSEYRNSLVNRLISTIDAKDAEIARLRTALKDCADDLGTYVEARYENTKNYPSEMRRYERDIAPVTAARELLK